MEYVFTVIYWCMSPGNFPCMFWSVGDCQEVCWELNLVGYKYSLLLRKTFLDKNVLCNNCKGTFDISYQNSCFHADFWRKKTLVRCSGKYKRDRDGLETVQTSNPYSCEGMRHQMQLANPRRSRRRNTLEQRNVWSNNPREEAGPRAHFNATGHGIQLKEHKAFYAISRRESVTRWAI